MITAVYIALTANLQLSNIVVGVLISLIILALVRPAGRGSAWHIIRGGSAVAFVRYTLNLIHDLMVSGIQVAGIVLDPKLPIRQGDIAIPTTCTSEAALALSAHAITVTPGEMVVEMAVDGAMYTHVLDTDRAEEGIIDAQKMREELLEKIAP